MRQIIFAATASALALLPVAANAGDFQVGDINVPDINAQNMDGCGLMLSRASVWRNDKNFEGPYIYVDDGDFAIVRLDDMIVKLKQVNEQRDMLSSKPTRNVFANADGTVTVTENTHTTKIFGGESWRVAGTLIFKVKGKTQTLAVKGEGGC